MEALLRQRPPPDRYQPRETSPAAIATGKIVKYKEKKAKKGDKVDKAEKTVKGGKGKKVKVIETAPAQPIVAEAKATAPNPLVQTDNLKQKGKASESSKLSIETPSRTTTMPTASTSSSKRKRDGKEKSSKSKKKSRHHDVKSRGRSRSRVSEKSHRKRVRDPSPSSESDLKTSDSETSSDGSSDDTDSEEEERRRRRARSRSRGRQRARSRARSRSRARYSSDESGSDSEDEDDKNEEPIFMAFTVPGGKTHMRPVKPGTSFKNFLETVYAVSNISQTILLDMSYELNGLTLQLSDEEDFKALVEAATYTSEMVRVKVERAEAAKPVSASEAAAVPEPASIIVAEKSEQKEKKALDKVKKAEKKAKAQQIKADEVVTDAKASLPQLTINETAGNGTITANDSIVTLDTSEDVPLAKVILKNAADAPIKKKEKVDKPLPVAAATNGEAVEKPKRKRRSAAEIEADNAAKEARKEALKVARAEKAAERREKAKAERKAAKAAAQAVEDQTQTIKPKGPMAVSVDIPPHTPAAPKELEQSPVKTSETISEDKTDDNVTVGNTSSATPKKRKSKKGGDEAIEPAAAKEGKELPSATPKTKRVKKSSKGEPSPAQEPEEKEEAVTEQEKESESVKKPSSPAKKSSAKSNGIVGAAKEDSTKQTCEVCFEKGHSKASCPVITGGKETVQKRYDELKAKKQRKTKPENDACKVLEGWLKAEKDHREQELRFSQNGTILYRRDKDGIHAGYASEAERKEDEEEQRFMTAALNKEKERIQAKAGQQDRTSTSLSPGKGRKAIGDISEKIQRDRERMVAKGSNDPLVHLSRPFVPLIKSGEQSSLEMDELASSQVTEPEEPSSILPRVSPTMSESELATSPMLMAGQSHTNGDVQEVTLPSAAAEEKSDGSSDTSDDSDGQDEQDEIEEEAEVHQEKERSESIASSNSAEKNDESEEEVDEIEATPAHVKPGKAPKSSSWVASIGSLVGFGGSSQDSHTPDRETNKSAIQAPPSGQRFPHINCTPMSSTPVNRRGRPLVGGARLSQLDTSAIKSSYSQNGTPRNNGASPVSKRAKAASPSKDKTVEESDSDDSDSDSDHDAKTASVSKTKLAGKKQKKPRASMLAKMTAS